MADDADSDFFELGQAQLDWVAAGNKPSHGPLAEVLSDLILGQWQAEYEGGYTFALMKALYFCIHREIKMPDWVCREFKSGIRAINDCDAASLDVVFGRPYPKGTNLCAMKKRKILRDAVFKRVREIKEMDPQTPVNRVLFRRVGKEVFPPIGGSEAEKLYYEAKKRWLWL